MNNYILRDRLSRRVFSYRRENIRPNSTKSDESSKIVLYFEVSDILKNDYFKYIICNNYQLYFAIYSSKLYIERNIFFMHFHILLDKNGFLIV